MSLSNRPLLATQADARLFQGRSVERERVLRAVERGYNVAIIGPRGSGKTSLLHQVYGQLAKRALQFPVLCDARPYRKWPLGFLIMLVVRLLIEAGREKVISDSLQEELQQNASRALGTEPTTSSGLALFGDESSPAQEQNLLEQLERSVSEVASRRGKVVFLIDNLGEAQSADFFRKSFSSLRDNLWALPALFVVTIDATEEAELLRPPVGSFFEAVVRLEDFGREEIRDLLAQRGIPDAKLAAKIFEVAGGNPRAVIELARRLELGELRVDDLEGLAAKTGAKPDEEDLDARILRYLATHGAVSASDPEFQAAMNVTRPRLAQVLGRLSAEGAIQRSRRGRKVYYSRGPIVDRGQGDEHDPSATSGA